MRRRNDLHVSTIIALIISLTLVACGDEDDDGGGPHADAKALTLGDFELGNLTEVESSEVRDEMEDFDYHENKAEGSFTMLRMRLHSGMALTPFGLTQTDSETGDEDDGAQFASFMDCAFDDDSAVLQAAGDRFTWDFSTPNFGKCMVTLMGSFLQNANANIAFSGYVTQSCPGADYSALDGLKFSDFLDPTKLAEVMQNTDTDSLGGCDLTDNEISYQFKMEMVGTLTGDVVFGDQRQSISVRMDAKEATMASDGGDCKFTSKAGEVTVADCVHRSVNNNLSTSNGEQSEERTLLTADTTGMTGSAANEFLTGGEIPVTFNGWSGSVTLDGSARPSYKLTKGTEEVTGLVGDWSSSSSGGSSSGGSTSGGSGSTTWPTTPAEEEEPASQYDIPALNLSSDAEVHFVGSYEGNESDQITVDVDRPGAPIILVLGSYDSAEYVVNVADGTTIELVIVSGYHASTVTGLASDTPVIASFYDSYSDIGSGNELDAKFPYFYAYYDDSEQQYQLESIDGEWQCTDKPALYQEFNWKDAQEAIKEITTKSVTTSQGSYSDGAYTVNAETSGHLDAERETWRCYKESDGTIVRHGWVEL